MADRLDLNKPILLNLGCGAKIDHSSQVINIDFPNNSFGVKPDLACDLRQIPLPDNFADTAYAIHVIEHFYTWEVEDVLWEWYRIIKPGGALVIECPDMSKIIGMLISGNHGIQKTWLGLYGDQSNKDPNMVHKWCYTKSMLFKVLEKTGFRNMEEHEAKFHVPIRDIRVVAYK
jgi:predicted SAM-dependent methyltransferase